MSRMIMTARRAITRPPLQLRVPNPITICGIQYRALSCKPGCRQHEHNSSSSSRKMASRTYHPARRRQEEHPFYDTTVKEYAQRPLTPVTLENLIEMAQKARSQATLVETAQWLQEELPVRLARRVRAMQNLPFIVGVNPWIRNVYHQYLESFMKIREFPKVTTMELEHSFTELLEDLTQAHQEVIPKLAKGFLECEKYMDKASIKEFLDGMIHARIGIRVLAEHYLALHNNSHGSSDPEDREWIGIINPMFHPASLIQSVSSYVHELCTKYYGSSPNIQLNGHIDMRFTYIPLHLEYMLMEIMKNSMRATVEYSNRIGRKKHPDIEVTIARGRDSVGIRVRDQGGGIPYDELGNIWEYSYTSVPKYEEGGVLADMSRRGVMTGVGGPIAGLGFGLPMTRLYARYFGGSFILKSIHGVGMDAFLRVPNIERAENVVIS